MKVIISAIWKSGPLCSAAHIMVRTDDHPFFMPTFPCSVPKLKEFSFLPFCKFHAFFTNMSNFRGRLNHQKLKSSLHCFDKFPVFKSRGTTYLAPWVFYNWDGSQFFISSVRSSNSHPDLLLIHHHPPTFSDHTGPQHWTFTFWATTAI